MKQSINKAYRYRRKIYAIVIALFFLGIFLRFSPAAIREELQDSFFINAVGFSNLNAMYFYTYMAMQIPVGIFADMYGPRKMILTGSLIMAAGSVMFGTAKTELILLLSRLLLGLGSSVFYISILKWQTNWFRQSEYGFITGLTTFSGNMGGAFAQGPLVILVGLLTWRMTFICTGIFIIALIILAYFLFVNAPEDKGFEAIADEKTDKRSKKISEAFINVISNKKVWPLFLYSFFCAGVSFTIGIWGVTLFSQIYDITKITAGRIMFWQTTAFCVSSILIGKISDKIKSRKLPAIVCVSVCLLIWCFIYFKGMQNIPLPVSVILIIIAGGFNCGAVMAITCSKEICDPEFSGISTSFINSAPFLGGSLLPLIFGFIIDKYSPFFSKGALYGKAFLLFVIFLSIGLLMSLLFTETKAKNIYKKPA